jgi:leucine-rich repeat protein SHOC2
MERTNMANNNSNIHTKIDNTVESQRRKVLVFPGPAGDSPGGTPVDKDFAIDEDDYLVIREILLGSGIEGDMEEARIETNVRWMIEIREDDDERRVCELGMPYTFNNFDEPVLSLPSSIGELKYLTTLDLRGSLIASLPPSIGLLQNLRDLDLSYMEDLFQLPQEIGDLVSLNILDLEESSITSLPPSIGRLRNLQYLNLSETRKLSKLPEELGNLASLNKLNLRGSTIASLPASIGRLQTLDDLILADTKKMSKLPEEIGDLTGLTKLSLKLSSIASLPPSIGQLRNLNDLNLSYTENLLELPEEIGDLASLTKLDLGGSSITSIPSSLKRLQNLGYLDLSEASEFQGPLTEIGHLTANLKVLDLSGLELPSLPDAIGRLKGLMFLNLYGISIPELKGNTLYEFLLMVARSCPLLGLIELKEGSLAAKEKENLDFSVACNRSRCRTGFGAVDKNDSVGAERTLAPELWPLFLSAATRAFDWNPNPYQSKSSSRSTPYTLPQQDAIYQFLVDGRELFLGVLYRRSQHEG